MRPVDRFDTATGAPLLTQDVRSRCLRDDPAMHYYDFWEGTCYQVRAGETDTSGTMFHVERDVHPAAFIERWRLVVDSATTIHATALRAWDQVRTALDARSLAIGTYIGDSTSMGIGTSRDRPGSLMAPTATCESVNDRTMADIAGKLASDRASLTRAGYPLVPARIRS